MLIYSHIVAKLALVFIGDVPKSFLEGIFNLSLCWEINLQTVFE